MNTDLNRAFIRVFRVIRGWSSAGAAHGCEPALRDRR